MNLNPAIYRLSKYTRLLKKVGENRYAIRVYSHTLLLVKGRTRIRSLGLPRLHPQHVCHCDKPGMHVHEIMSI